MSLVACSGTWTTVTVSTGLLTTARVPSCSGTLQTVPDSGPFGLPSITYDDANAILVAILSLLALVWVIRQIMRIVR